MACVKNHFLTLLDRLAADRVRADHVARCVRADENSGPPSLEVANSWQNNASELRAGIVDGVELFWNESWSASELDAGQVLGNGADGFSYSNAGGKRWGAFSGSR